MKRLVYCVSGVFLVACQGTPQNDPQPTIEAAAIVNGQTETGYPAVGALTMWAGGDYYGSFCTGTLIRNDWVLTAAHCVEDAEVSQTRFYVGNNANNPNTGTFYRALEFKVHEQYDGRSLENDIALVRLQTAVTDVAIIPRSTANLNPYEGDVAFYVGFGATEGINESGSGLKRSTSFPISQVYSDVFESTYNGTGTCFGDSGGPALLTIGGTLSVVGVTSAGAACNGANCDPCKTATISTRVDAFSTWIAGKLNEAPPDCNDNASICGCDEACQPNGTCDDSVCTIDTCSGAYDCLVDCGANGTCQEQCFTNASPTAQQQLNNLFQCLDDNCDANLSESAYAQCAAQNCGDETNACFGETPVETGNDTCSEVTDCFGGCSTETCYGACYAEGTAAAQTQIDAMYACFDARCGTIEDEDAWQTCVADNCGDELNTCFGEQESCNLGGGSCGAGTACYPTTTEGFNGCFDSANKPVGAACNDASSDLECVDGAACYEGVCVRFCTNNSVCGGGTCDLEIAVNGFGLCGAGEAPCTDADNDGYCAEDECNDGNANVRPNAAEVCGNGIDDNCNGQSEEGCGSCTDVDQDGFCVENDCNDNDPTINANAAERCGDSVDNNCSGQADEGCDTCVDGDGDGYCASAGDCDDSNPSRHPTVAETCGNGVDDNCNGQTDEGCSTTNPDGDPINPDTTTPRGGNSTSGCASGDASLPLLAGLAGLIGLAGIAMRRRTVR